MRACLRSCVVAGALLLLLQTDSWADANRADPLAPTPTVKAPAAVAIRAQIGKWLDQRQADEKARSQAMALWKPDAPEATSAELLERLCSTFALVDPRARELVEICARARSSVVVPSQSWLQSAETSPFEAHNLRLYYAQWLSHERLYDELMEQVRGLEPRDVVDPAGLLFCQSVAYHRLLDKEDGLKAIDRLLSDVADVPNRYKSVATLMRVDLEGLDEETLDHISRRMDDIQRRLDLGRAGKQVVKIEDGVIESLDKLIEDMEKKQQQQQASSAGMMRPSSPMKDSQLAPLRGAGEVDRKQIGHTAGWGDMPAKQREEALQQIGKDFPAHYRDAIEQYFRKLASESGDRQ